MQALSELHACQRRIDGYESIAYHSELRLRCIREDVEELHQELQKEQIFKKKFMKLRRKLQVLSAKHVNLHKRYVDSRDRLFLAGLH